MTVIERSIPLAEFAKLNRTFKYRQLRQLFLEGNLPGAWRLGRRLFVDPVALEEAIKSSGGAVLPGRWRRTKAAEQGGAGGAAEAAAGVGA
jgi:hypothetical protein